MKTVWKVLSYVLTALAATVLTAGVFIFTLRARPAAEYSKLGQLEELIENCFIGDYDDTEVKDAAAEAMIGALGDRWSYYIPADYFQSYADQMNNEYVGIGVIVSKREEDDKLEIQKVYDGSPAAKAGIQPGDILLEAGGQSCRGLNPTEVGDIVRGPADSEIELKILRAGEELTFMVKRGVVQLAVAEGKMLNGGVGYVRITNFDSRCAEETIEAIEKLLDEGADSLIFDVRNNPGGYKNELVDVLDYLLPEGALFRSEDYAGRTSVDYSDEKYLDVPMAVLVNSESYSAAEFFAAALEEYDAAEVVGQQTCGKGYFQQTFPLGDGSAVGLSVGKYVTPNGVSLAGVGITPDVTVEVDEQTFAAIYAGILEPEDDPQVQAAKKVLPED